jgi:2-aminoadipate transaminase
MPTDWTNHYASRTRHIKASVIRELLKLAARSDVISFAGGLPATETLPVEAIEKACAEILATKADRALQYGPTEGHLPLREALAAMYQKQGVPATADNILITTGSQQGLDLVGRTLIDHEDMVLTEAPTYIGAIQAWRPCGADFVGIPMDDDGMKMGQIDFDQRFKLLYLLPNFQNPSGVSLSEQRRRQAVMLAHRHDFIIVEDDPYRALRYSGEDVPAIIEIEAAMLGDKWNANSRVVHLGTFSKIMAPGLRVGWILAPTEVLRMLVLCKQGADLHSSTLTQFIAAELLQNGTIEANYPKLVSIYRERRDTMVEALQTYIGERGAWTYPRGGLFIWLTLPGVDTQELLQEALKRNVAFVPGDSFYFDGRGKESMRLNFSCMPPEKIREGIRRLGELVAELQPAAPVAVY